MTDSGWRVEAPGLAIETLPPTPIHILRVRVADQKAVLAARTLADFRAIGPNQSGGDEPRLAWMAPGEWVVTGASPKPAWLKALAKSPSFHAADVGHGRVRFAISGPRARDLLAKGCSVDFHPRAFGAGRCAKTLFAQVPVLIDQISDAPLFHLYGDISHEAHLSAWLVDAAVEFRFEGNRS